jgi:hypothetical protein
MYYYLCLIYELLYFFYIFIKYSLNLHYFSLNIFNVFIIFAEAQRVITLVNSPSNVVVIKACFF